jgi:hypothetical protein
MDRTLFFEGYVIEAWGHWYIEWQKHIKDSIKK